MKLNCFHLYGILLYLISILWINFSYFCHSFYREHLKRLFFLFAPSLTTLKQSFRSNDLTDFRSNWLHGQFCSLIVCSMTNMTLWHCKIPRIGITVEWQGARIMVNMKRLSWALNSLKTTVFLCLPRGLLCCITCPFSIRVLAIWFLLFFPSHFFTSVASSPFYKSLHSIFDAHFHKNSIFMRMPRFYL